MRIVIPGGSGQVGQVLNRALSKEEHDVIVLSRNPKADDPGLVYWDGESLSVT